MTSKDGVRGVGQSGGVGQLVAVDIKALLSRIEGKFQS